MTNLDRLKGTPYLIDGFESFLKGWLSPQEPNPDPLPWSEEEMELVRKLPESALQFYQVLQRWPGSEIVGERSQDDLRFPPRRHREWDASAEKYIYCDEKPRLVLAYENQECWWVDISIDPDSFGKLYTNEYNWEYAETEEGFPMEVPIDEFLVTFGFRELVICGPHLENSDPRFADSKNVFSGRYQADRGLSVHYHPDGLLWLTENGRPWWGSQRIRGHS